MENLHLGRALGSHEPNMSTEHGEARSHPNGGYVTSDGHHHGGGGDSRVGGSDRGGSSFAPPLLTPILAIEITALFMLTEMGHTPALMEQHTRDESIKLYFGIKPLSKL